MYSTKRLLGTALSVMLFTEWRACNDRAQRALIRRKKKRLTALTDLDAGEKKGNKCRRQDGECDSDHRVLISGKVALEAGSTKTDGNAVHRFPYEASHTTRNPFMRWLSECNATNLGLMKNTGAERQRWRLSAISKRIFERPDVPPPNLIAGGFKRTSYQVTQYIDSFIVNDCTVTDAQMFITSAAKWNHCK